MKINNTDFNKATKNPVNLKEAKLSAPKKNADNNSIVNNISSNTEQKINAINRTNEIRWGADYSIINDASNFLENIQNFVEPINSDKGEISSLSMKLYDEINRLKELTNNENYYLNKSLEYIKESGNKLQCSDSDLEKFSHILLENRDKIISNNLGVQDINSDSNIHNSNPQTMSNLCDCLLQNSMLNTDDKNKIITNFIQKELEKGNYIEPGNEEKIYEKHLLKALIMNKDIKEKTLANLALSPLVINRSTSIIDGRNVKNNQFTLKSIWNKIPNFKNRNNYSKMKNWWNSTAICITGTAFTFRHWIAGALGGTYNSLQNWIHPKTPTERFTTGIIDISKGLWDKFHSELLSLKGDFFLGGGISGGISGIFSHIF